MSPSEGSDSLTALRFSVPTRGLIGVRSAMLTATKGTVIMDTTFDDFKPVVGAIAQREKGSLLAFEGGTPTLRHPVPRTEAACLSLQRMRSSKT